MDGKSIGKTIKGVLYLTIGGETYLICNKIYDLYSTKACMTFAQGAIKVPYFWLIEIMAIPLTPIMIKLIEKAITNNKISNDTDLVELFNKIKKED